MSRFDSTIPLDSFQTFGDLLKYSRRRARLTQREVAIAVGYSETQIGKLEKNQRRPDLTALKALFVPALHFEDEPELIARFLELAQSARQEAAPAPGFAPYKGLLFFDEADSLFGKRTEVKDAQDRYANLEVSYLLERMERFKGLAILATNRKRDLDEAFLRRLRFLIDFPLPGTEERLRIWKQVMPPGVDVSEIDFEFLANRFSVAGGHIRSIVLHACLQAARPGGPRKLTLGDTVIKSVLQKKFAKARGTKPMVHATACPFVSPTPQTADAVEGHNLDCPNPFSGWPF